jgi:signal peptidase I
VQRAVWQPVYYSDFAPIRNDRLAAARYEGPPWDGDPNAWELHHNNGREYRSTTVDPTLLTWDSNRRAITDWNAYNMFDYPRNMIRFFPVSDVRVSANVFMERPGLSTTFSLEARSHLFDFTIQENGRQSKVILSMQPLFNPDGAARVVHEEIIDLPMPLFNVEFWHADQAMRVFIDGEEVATLEYDWSAMQRLKFATGDFLSDDVDSLLDSAISQPQIRWRFEGTQVVLNNVRLDRDLHYRHDRLQPTARTQFRTGHGFGTHPTDNPGILGPDQFMMCGDNSQRSLDSRLWGDPHPLVVEQIGDDSPFVVNRKMLIGKAWVVYFPAPYSITNGGPGIVPDFGRLRFIR